jgi:hypothetical protein
MEREARLFRCMMISSARIKQPELSITLHRGVYPQVYLPTFYDQAYIDVVDRQFGGTVCFYMDQSDATAVR